MDNQEGIQRDNQVVEISMNNWNKIGVIQQEALCKRYNIVLTGYVKRKNNLDKVLDCLSPNNINRGIDMTFKGIDKFFNGIDKFYKGLDKGLGMIEGITRGLKDGITDKNDKRFDGLIGKSKSKIDLYSKSSKNRVDLFLKKPKDLITL